MTIGLIQLGFTVVRSRSDKGPDAVVETPEGQIWIEAVAPSAGTTTDRVPEQVMDGSFTSLPRRQCLLRLAQGLETKRMVLAEYIRRKIIPESGSCIIAISACDLNQFGPILGFPCDPPLTLLAGVGDMVVTIGGERDPYNKRQTSINRDSGSQVNTTMFDRDDFRIVAGVLYSAPDPLNAPLPPQSTFILYLNPKALNPIPEMFRMKLQTWSETRNATMISWNKKEPGELCLTLA